MSKNHFLPFQINTIIFILVIFFTKLLLSAILDVRDKLLITFLAILDQYGIFLFFTKWPPALILDVQNSLLIAFLAISNFTFDRISHVLAILDQ